MAVAGAVVEVVLGPVVRVLEAVVLVLAVLVPEAVVLVLVPEAVVLVLEVLVLEVLVPEVLVLEVLVPEAVVLVSEAVVLVPEAVVLVLELVEGGTQDSVSLAVVPLIGRCIALTGVPAGKLTSNVSV